MLVMTNESGQQPAPRPNEGEDPGWFPLHPQQGPEGGHWQGQPPLVSRRTGPPDTGRRISQATEGPAAPGHTAPRPRAAMADGPGREATNGTRTADAAHWRSPVAWRPCWSLAPSGDSSAMPSAVPAPLG